MPFRSRTHAGKRDRRITIQQRAASDTATASGFPTDGTWTALVSSIPAARFDVQGYERLKADQNGSAFDVRFETTYRADCDPELVDVPKTRRIVSDGRTYDVVAAQQVGRKRGIEFWTIASTKVA